MPATPTYPDVTVELVGEDGNVFAVVGRVEKAIRRAHGNDAADEFADAAFDCTSYDEVLNFVMRTVEVT